MQKIKTEVKQEIVEIKEELGVKASLKKAAKKTPQQSRESVSTKVEECAAPVDKTSKHLVKTKKEEGK